jgi:hypothetical protein
MLDIGNGYLFKLMKRQLHITYQVITLGTIIQVHQLNGGVPLKHQEGHHGLLYRHLLLTMLLKVQLLS